MRETKFRAWEKVDKQMHYFDSLYDIGLFAIILGAKEWERKYKRYRFSVDDVERGEIPEFLKRSCKN